MSKQIFLPESMYSIDSKMTHEKLIFFYENQSPITGKVVRLDFSNQLLEVNVGRGIIAKMPFEESTIYPTFRKDSSISPNIYSLVGRNIQAKVIGLQNDNIFLSRKENMLEALEYLKEQTQIQFASITSFSLRSAFIDIGAGIYGRCSPIDFCRTIFSDVKDVGFKEGDIISVEIIGFNEELESFDLSRVNLLPSFDEVLNEKDTIVCKVFNKVKSPSGIGYYVLINKDIVGIMDSETELEYGDEVVATVSKLSTKGPRLDMVKKSRTD